MVTVSALGYPPFSWSWELYIPGSPAAQAFGLGQKRYHYGFYGLWAEGRLQGFSVFVVVQAQYSLEKFHFYFPAFCVGGVLLLGFLVLRYLFCLYMHSEDNHSSQFSPWIMWAPGTELGLSGLVASVLICQTILPACFCCFVGFLYL